MLLFAMVRGGYLRDKNTCARSSTENVGGGLYAGRYGIMNIGFSLN